MVSNSEIGERLKSSRKAAGLKRDQLAVAAGLTSNTIRNYEEGLTFPSLDPLYRISRVLEVDIRWLIDGTEVAA